jgi:hypothetical protein
MTEGEQFVVRVVGVIVVAIPGVILSESEGSCAQLICA